MANGTSSSANLSFNVQLETASQVSQPSVTVVQSLVPLAGGAGTDAWYSCNLLPGDEQPLAPHACSFKYHYSNNTLEFRSDWICADLDPADPYEIAPPNS